MQNQSQSQDEKEQQKGEMPPDLSLCWGIFSLLSAAGTIGSNLFLRPIGFADGRVDGLILFGVITQSVFELSGDGGVMNLFLAWLNDGVLKLDILSSISRARNLLRA